MEALERYRDDLRRIVSHRLDDRLSARLDESDIVQDVMAVAALEVGAWEADPEKSTFACLYRLVLDRITRVHRDHLSRGKRSVVREQNAAIINDHSAIELADRLVSQDPSPSERLAKKEARMEVHRLLSELPPTDREILVMRFLEAISVKDVAQILGISEGAVNMRQLRALQKVRSLLNRISESEF